MSILRVNDIQRATLGSRAVIFDDPVIITTGSISASVITAGQLSSSRLIARDIPKEKLTDDARSWVNILNKPPGLITSSADIPNAISGSNISFANISASGVIATTGYLSGSGTKLYNIPNTGLTNSSITLNGTSVSLGGTRNITTAEITESNNLYYTDVRVKSKLNAEGVVSASGQIDYQSITGHPSINTLGGDGNQSFNLGQGMFITASGGAEGIIVTTDAANYTLRFKTVTGTVSSSAQVQSALPAGIISSSGQVVSALPEGTVSSSAQYPGWVTASSQIDIRNTTGIATLVTTGSNTFTGTQTVSGSVTLTGNLLVQGTSSVLYTTSSQLTVGTNTFILNTNSAVRYGGMTVFDSGSSGLSGSLLWDSFNDVFLYVHAGTTNTSSMVITGPQNTGALGSEVFLTADRITKVQAPGDHIVDSQISDNGTLVGITGNLKVTGSITASGVSGVSYTTLSNIPAGIVSSSGQIDAGNTINFATAVAGQLGTVHSGSYLGTATTNNLGEGTSSLYYTDTRVKNKISVENVHSGSYLGTATTVNLPEDPSGSNLYFTPYRVLTALPINTVSSSNQIAIFLPAGTVSSSGQISPITVTSASTAVTASYALTSLGTTATNTDGLPEGSSSFYYTDSRVKTKLNVEIVHSGSYLGTATTTNLTEGTNLYFTNTRVITALPIGTVSSSTQTSANLPAGTVSSSTQTRANLPTGTVSSSIQINTGSFSGSLTGTFPYGSLTSIPSGIFSSSAQLSAGIVSSSGQVSYTGLASIPSGIVSSSGQVTPLLPVDTVSSSAQTLANLPTGTVSSSTQINTGSFSGSFTGTFPYGSLTSIPSGIFSSSAQLPSGIVSSSTQINTGAFSGSLSGSVLIYATQAVDATVTGLLKIGLVGESLVFGDVCYMKSDGKFWKADANATGLYPAVAMSTATYSSGSSGSFLMVGQARQDSWNWTIGGVVYLSTTAGGMTQTQPAATDDVIQVLGVAFPNADTVYFSPSLDYITHT